MKASNLREGPAVPAAAAPQAQQSSDSTETVVDGEGRTLTLRRLSLLDEQDLVAVMGVHAQNDNTLARGLMAAQVAAINGVPIPMPRTNVTYRGMLAQVGIAGADAVFRQRMPRLDGEPVAILPGQPEDYRLLPHEEGVAVYQISQAGEEDREIALAKNS